MCGCKVGWVQAPEDEDQAPGDAEVKTWSQLVELPSSKTRVFVCLASQTVTACQHSYLSQHGMLTHDFYYFKMNTDTSICRRCYLSRRKSSCIWKMPKTCFAHHIQAQFGQMSGAFAVSSLLTASVPRQSAALQPCKNHGWGKLVQICPGPIWPSIALFLASHNVTVAASLAGGAPKGLQKIWTLTWCLCDNTIAYIRLQLTCPSLVVRTCLFWENSYKITLLLDNFTGKRNKRINLLPWEKCEEYQSRPIRNKRWVVEYILVPETIMNILFCFSCECRNTFAKKMWGARKGQVAS